tara:strand:+ start:859 stop:1314 length:456 start_codon:yes stop_codon:yes gene_type:complete
MTNNPSFRILDNRGFQITFPNEWTVSVIIGKGAYCHNKDDDELDYTNSKPCPTAEIAAWYGDNPDVTEWHKFEFDHDTVSGWRTPLDVLEFMNMISKKTTTPDGSSIHDVILERNEERKTNPHYLYKEATNEEVADYLSDQLEKDNGYDQS